MGSPFTALKDSSFGQKCTVCFGNSSSMLISYRKLAPFGNFSYIMLGNLTTIADNIIGPLSVSKSIFWAKFVPKVFYAPPRYWQNAMILAKWLSSGTAKLHVGWYISGFWNGTSRKRTGNESDGRNTPSSSPSHYMIPSREKLRLSQIEISGWLQRLLTLPWQVVPVDANALHFFPILLQQFVRDAQKFFLVLWQTRLDNASVHHFLFNNRAHLGHIRLP